MNCDPFADGLFDGLPDPPPGGPRPQGQPPDDGETSPMGDQQRTEPPAPTGGSPKRKEPPGPPPEPTAGGSEKPPPPAPSFTQSVPNAAKQPSTPFRSTKAIRLTPPARRNAPKGTSEKAAERIAGNAWIPRDRILAFIAEQGAHGATDDEGETALGIKPQTYTPRRGELVALGLVVDNGRRRPTSSGRPAAVWVTRNLALHTPPTDGGAT
jgi:hypothetical protein